MNYNYAELPVNPDESRLVKGGEPCDSYTDKLKWTYKPKQCEICSCIFIPKTKREYDTKTICSKKECKLKKNQKQCQHVYYNGQQCSERFEKDGSRIFCNIHDTPDAEELRTKHGHSQVLPETPKDTPEVNTLMLDFINVKRLARRIIKSGCCSKFEVKENDIEIIVRRTQNPGS